MSFLLSMLASAVAYFCTIEYMKWRFRVKMRKLAALNQRIQDLKDLQLILKTQYYLLTGQDIDKNTEYINQVKREISEITGEETAK